MARIIQVCILIMAILFIAEQGATQESLRNLTGLERDQTLNWENSELSLNLNIPPGASAATLTLFADPDENLPAPGTMMVVRVNDAAGVVVNPRPEAFSARIDVPAAHLRAGHNRIKISFEGTDPNLCPTKPDGGWRLDLARSRFDLSVSPDISSFATLEDWLSEGAWALSRVSIAKGALGNEAYAALGALVTQGLAVRAGRVPEIVSPGRIAGLGFSAQIDAAIARPAIALRPGNRPLIEFQGRSEEDILALARLFAGRLIHQQGTRVTPALLARAPLVSGSQALDGVKAAFAEPAWRARPYENTVRTPHGGITRLVVDMERSDWVSTDSTVLISVDGKRPLRKRLKHRLNHFVVPLSQKSATVVRSFSIAREAHPTEQDQGCMMQKQDAPLRLVSARIESSGFEDAHGLARFAVDAAPFAKEAGIGAGIVFATGTETQLYAAWRAAARIALVAGTPLTGAWYGTEFEAAPQDTALIVLGPRKHLTPQLVAQMPNLFATGAAAGPGAYQQRHKKPSLSLSRIAFADVTTIPSGLGVAGWAKVNQRSVLILTGEQENDFVPAMQSFANGPAMNFFSGEVVRWRAGLVKINDIGTKAVNSSSKNKIPAVLYFIAGICLVGLWISLWRRAYANWEPI